MLSADSLALLLDRHRPVLTALAEIEALLNRRYYAMAEPVRALVLSALSGEPLLFIGPPGTAKSQLIRSFCRLIGVDATGSGRQTGTERSADYFEYLLTPFTEPSELFGYYDIAALHRDGVMTRLDAGMMQHARVVFLDEVFNASSAILNAILAVLNERVFHDRGRANPVALECLMGATNDIPRADELLAVFDRFLIRCRLDNAPAEPAELEQLMQAGWRATYDPAGALVPTHGDLLPRLAMLRGELASLGAQFESTGGGQRAFYGNLSFMVALARQYGASALSNRRLVKMMHVMVLHGLYRAALGGGQPLPGIDELRLLPRYFLDRADPVVIDRMQRLPYPMPDPGLRLAG